MEKYLKKLLSLIICLCLVALVCFLLPRLLPGDPVAYLAGAEESALSEEDYNNYKHLLHLDEPIFIQFSYFIKDLLRGDLGYSFKQEANVSYLIAGRIGNTLLIAIPALLISSASGLFLGLYCAQNKGKFLDRFSGAATTIVNALPMFVTGIVLLIVFAYRLKWLPYSGLSSAGISPKDSGFVLDRVVHLALPVLTLAIAEFPARFLLVRSAAERVYKEKPVLFARERGLSERTISLKYVLPEILPEFLASVGAAFSACVGGSVVIENIFSIRGMGTLLMSAAGVLDYPLLQGVLFVSVALMAVGIVVFDILCILATPKLKRGIK